MRNLDLQIARRGQTNAVGTIKQHLNVVHICSRMNDKIVFNFGQAPVVDNVNAGINVALEYFPIIGNVGKPLFRVLSNEIIGLGDKFFLTFGSCL